MSLFNFSKPKKEEPKQAGPAPAPAAVQQETLSQQSGDGSVKPKIQQQQPGSRIEAVMGRMYTLVVSADLDKNSCFVESGDLKVGETEVPRKGTYDNMITALSKTIHGEERARFLKLFGRIRLTEFLLEGHSWMSERYSVADEIYEFRVERIPESEKTIRRVRCCIFIRPVESQDDDGINEDEVIDVDEKIELTDSEKMLDSMFVSCYEIVPDKNMIVSFDKVKGRFVKSDNRFAMKEGIEAWIRRGVISAKSAQLYLDFCRKGFLEKKTLQGQYIVDVYLRAPSESKYRWYEEVVVPYGRNFVVHRRDIDAYKKVQIEEMREEEFSKFFDYSRTLLKTVAGLVEFRNEESGAHITHVNEITSILLKDIAERSPQYGLDKAKIRLYSDASTIHDIGKVTIPDEILNKPGHYTPEEYEIMKQHTVNGAAILDRMGTKDQEELYACCRDIALHHHERWDGKGYPEGLVGDQISIGAQAVGLADAFDALVSVRCYKDAYPQDLAYKMIRNGECGAFNPRLLESLKACIGSINQIYADEAAAMEKAEAEADTETEIPA